MTASNAGSSTALKVEIQQALSVLTNGDLQKTAKTFFNALGYSSERTLELDGKPRSFVNRFDSLNGASGTKTEKSFLKAAQAVHIVFQITDEEIQSSRQTSLLEGTGFDTGRVKSFLFMAVKLQSAGYARGKYAEMTREISKRFGMPTVVLFLNDDKATIAFANRRKHKKQKQDRDVLGKVSLIRNVNCANPHRAHLDILADLCLDQCLGWIEQKQQQRNFDGLLAAWLAKLDTEELNKRFYKELFDWFQWAVTEAKFPPSPPDKSVPKEDHIIRLITRILFIWFIKEKDLVADELFDEIQIKPMLNNYSRDKDDYYRAVLQNLFFATLNTEQSKRRFSKASGETHRNFNLYRYKDLLANSKELLRLMKQTPFINGGLFDCLDSEQATSDGGYRLDCFSDNSKHRKLLSVPNGLFFDDQRGLFPLLNKYKFTVEENTPIEQEVALDPELLGKVFENLLAAYNPETRGTARKQTGSYYTPRAIVDYMVDEALVASLAEKIKLADGDAKFLEERLHYLMDYSDAFNDAEELFEKTEKDEIIQAISDIKVLDPAAGSGAFPMGVLHKLTLALRRIDPNNTGWERLQKERAKQRANEAFDTKDDEARRDELLEISDTFKSYRDSDFGRKLYLIQNSIFGVDIQPIACQIAKLRFFISLAIEQQRDDSKENYGIKPLPNLETRFVAADTLIGLQLTGEDLLRPEQIKKLEKQLRQNRERHFNAGSRRKKLACSKEDKKLRQQLAKVLEEGYQKDGVWREARRINDEAMRPLTAKRDKRNAQIIAAKQLTLMGEEHPHQAQMTDDNIAKLEQEIADKNKLGTMILKHDKAVHDEEIWERATAAAKKRNDTIHAESQKIAEWDPYDQNAKADWFDAKWMFSVTEGFDIVIGNPPYVQLQKDGGRLGKLYKDKGFITFVKTGDIYQLFYEKSCQLLAGNGHVCFITSNSWMRAKYGEKLREFFSTKHSPLRLIDVGKDAFEAIVDTNILLVRKGNTDQSMQGQCKAVDMDSVPDKSFPPAEQYWSELQHSGDVAWSVLPPMAQKIRSKIERIGTPLKDWDVSIYRGVVTGCNEAFIIDQNKRDELVAADPKSAEIIKPIVRGRDIRRYRCEWARLWIIFIPWHFPLHKDKSISGSSKKAEQAFIEQYPIIYNHLLQYKDKLSERNKSETGVRYEWYAMQRCANTYHEEFKKAKLIWKRIGSILRFSFDEEGEFSLDSTCIATGERVKFLTAVLNSKLGNYLLQDSPTTGMGDLIVSVQAIEPIRVPKISANNCQIAEKIENLVDKILAAKTKNSNADTSELETKIDQRVYQLYNLTVKEIELIEKTK